MQTDLRHETHSCLRIRRLQAYRGRQFPAMSTSEAGNTASTDRRFSSRLQLKNRTCCIRVD